MTTGIHALTHVGLLTDDIERTAGLWRTLFGARAVGRRPTWHAPEEGVLSTFLTVPGGVVEPLQPTRDNIYRRAFREGRRGYHISVQVEDIRGVVQELRQAGIWVQLRPPGEVLTIHRGWIDPDSTGLPIELIDTAEMMGFVSEEEVAALVGDSLSSTTDASWVTRWTAIGHLVHDLDPVRRVIRDVLGFAPDTDAPVDMVELGARVQRFRLPSGPALELVQPLDGDSVPGRRLDTAGPGIGYLSLEVRDLAEAVRSLSDREAWLSCAPAGPHLAEHAWVHARSTEGLPVRLVAGHDGGMPEERINR